MEGLLDSLARNIGRLDLFTVTADERGDLRQYRRLLQQLAAFFGDQGPSPRDVLRAAYDASHILRCFLKPNATGVCLFAVKSLTRNCSGAARNLGVGCGSQGLPDTPACDDGHHDWGVLHGGSAPAFSSRSLLMSCSGDELKPTGLQRGLWLMLRSDPEGATCGGCRGRRRGAAGGAQGGGAPAEEAHRGVQ